MEEAERIARDEHGSVKLAVISGRFLPHLSLRPEYSFVRTTLTVPRVIQELEPEITIGD